PLFRDAQSADYHLQFGSPAIDSGTSTNQTPVTDAEGVGRPQDGNGDCYAAFDMGAFEAPGVDCIPPVTTATLTPSSNNAGWNKTNVTVSLNAADNPGGSGVQAIRYSLSGAQTSPTVTGPNPSSVTITAEGVTSVNYSAIDNAGNSETGKSQPVKIDKSNPVISGMPSGCVLSPAKHQLVTVATITASDSLSAVASLYVAATSNEADSGTGGGDVAGDVVINGGTVQLRAERAPSGKGRIYTITATATDFAGNSVTTSATCSVPK